MLAVLLAACSAPMPTPPASPETRTAPATAPETLEAPAATAPVESTPHGVSEAATVGTVAAEQAAAKPEYEKAVAALRAGNDKEAEPLFIALAQRYPALASPHTNLGIIHYQRGQLAEAEQSFKHAIELHAQDAVAWNYLGMIYRRQGHFTQARDAYNHALAVRPDYAYAHLNLAILCELYLGDLNEALTHYRDYQRLAPEDSAHVAAWLSDLEQRLHVSKQEEPKS